MDRYVKGADTITWGDLESTEAALRLRFSTLGCFREPFFPNNLGMAIGILEDLKVHLTVLYTVACFEQDLLYVYNFVFY